VESIEEDNVAALYTRVDAALYAAGVDERLADVAWLAPRATAHDGVLTWASDAGPVVPLPLLSLFRSEDAVRAMLRERAAQLVRLLADVARGREYGVRLFRVDDELSGTLATFSPSVAAMERDAAAAPTPGQRYLLGRKLEAARKEQLRRVGADVAAAALERLSACALASTQDPLPAPTGEQAGSAVLNAAFLVAHERIDDFQAAVTALVREYEGRGFRIQFTGPWPPYHFTRGEAAASAAATGGGRS
jgi:hypothetical protein